MDSQNYITHSEEETIQLGVSFAQSLLLGATVALYGDLGSGKTELIKGICSYFDVEEIVSSPTFTIINQYNGKYDGDEINIYHVDLYRIKNAEELNEIGFVDCLSSPIDIKLVEWAENARKILPVPRYDIYIKQNPDDEFERIIQIIYKER